jgi:protein-tyrosine phosphatase
MTQHISFDPARLQNLPLEGAKNIRDLGGLPTGDNRRIRPRLLLRGDALHQLTAGDIALLKGTYGLAKVIDLRTDRELGEKPDLPLEGVTYLRRPILASGPSGIARDERTKQQRQAPDMPALYRSMVADPACREQLRLILREIFTTAEGSVLFHCTAGKDRTGIVALLLEGLLGVPEEVIMADYLHTNVVAETEALVFRDTILMRTGDAAYAEIMRQAWAARESYLLGAVDYIRGHFGSVEAYVLRGLEIGGDEIRAFREKLLEE